jgi:predicted exporter
MSEAPPERSSAREAPPPRPRRLAPIALWLVVLVLSALAIVRTPMPTDMSVFLPQRPTPAQRLLIDHLSQGVAARLLLVAVDGVPPAQQAAFSRELAGIWRADDHFRSVNNGDLDGLQADQALLFERRYPLSPAIGPARFEVPALRESLARTVDALGSSAGVFAKSWLLRDPTGEMLALLGTLDAGPGPRLHEGVWVSADGARLMFLLDTRAAGGDLDGQEGALAALDAGFARARAQAGLASDVRARVSGPGRFAVESRAAIRDDVTRLSLVGTALILGLLGASFRSPRAIALALAPIASAVAVATAAVALGFGAVHGLTLGFGTTLIGEAVDYALYHLARSASRAPSPPGAFWATIRLGVLTSVAGFGALLFSGFPGLAQLAVFSIAGLVAAASVTRWVLPALTPTGFRPRELAGLERHAQAALRGLHRLRAPALALVAAAALLAGLRHAHLWDPDIAALNPVSRAAQALDAELREALGAPDARVMVIVQAAGQGDALQAARALGDALDAQVRAGRLGGYESPATLLPPPALQRARQAALPDADTLRARLREAAQGLPLRVERLEGFVADVQRAREAAPVTLADLEGTQIGMRAQSQLVERDGHWAALLALRAPAGAVLDPARLAAELVAPPGATLTVLDLKAETDRLYAGYLREASLLSLGGALAVVALLAASLRSPRAVLRVCAPLAGAVVLVIGGFAAAGRPMNLLHLIGLLLVVAIGSNYALFVHSLREGALSRAPSSGTLASLVLANGTTLAGFGVLAFSQVPLLAALGTTVGAGCALALLLSGAWIGPRGGDAGGGGHA